MKKVLGLDLGTTSVGWAMVNQAEKEGEKCSIISCGSRVVPISSDEKDSFEKGKSITTNADRALKRSMRRNLQRRKQRRDNLITIFKKEGWITDSSILTESGKDSTYQTLKLRAKAASEIVSLDEFARVLLSINKKRGYKSSRRTDSSEEGQLIDGMQISKELYSNGLTPAQYCKIAIDDGKPARCDFYRSDLESEFNRIWEVQSKYYPDILTDDFKNQLSRQGKAGTTKIFLAKYGIYTADNKGKERRTQAILWRVDALSKKLEPETMAYVISDLRGAIAGSSGYLGEISDRSKELYFNGETIGQYLIRSISENPQFSTKNKVFYRQDYIDEFNTIWDTQARFHKELTPDLKRAIANNTLFYQRQLKSQKGLISFCEFESRPIKVIVDGKEKTKITGSRVAPRSSLLFQEFKIWQVLNNLVFIDRATGLSTELSAEEKEILSQELIIQPSLKQSDVLKLFGKNIRKYKLNYEKVEGNDTLSKIFSKYIEIVNASGHGEYDISKMRYSEVFPVIEEVLRFLGCNKDIFTFSSSLPKEQYEQQPLFKLWHLLYSYEGDKSNTGTESLIRKITEITGLGHEWATILSGITFKDDYASLSHKAISKILPHLKAGLKYDESCKAAGYNHSHFETKEDLEKKQLVDKLGVLPKGALRNPIVEKIINQMINVVNTIADVYGKPDEIHIELARELKQSAKDREKATNNIQANNRRNEEIEILLRSEFGLTTVRKADILRYRLYDELKDNGYKTLYSNRYISPTQLFSKEIEIEHIIPQALLFDDSFANKTLEFGGVNREKSNTTANDYVKSAFSPAEYEQYRLRIEDLASRGIISEKKRNYLLMTQEDIPTGFIDRDLRDSQYIAKKSRELLQEYVKTVIPTTGSVTSKLREDWQLVDVMKEINFDKYDKAGKTHWDENFDGSRTKRIDDGWTKRNDHRHHAMDAITIAFTKPEHIQILNNLKAKSNKDEKFINMYLHCTSDTGKKRIFTPPMPLDEFRREVKRQLNSTLVSIKAKNKVATKNINKIKTANGDKKSIELTPRGALHKEQVYGKRYIYEAFEVPINGKMTGDVVEAVASKRIREALLARLQEFGGDPKKAFTGKNSPDKNPIWLDNIHSQSVKPKVKCVRFKTVYSIRKDIDASLSVDKVLDKKARDRIKERIDLCGGNVRTALSNLEDNPIYLDDAKTIPIKRVTIIENFPLVPIHNKRDNTGNLILDQDGKPIPSDYVNLRNNHHVALYKDKDDQIQEKVVSLFEALNRINNGLPAVDKTYNSELGWSFLFTLKANEMFVFPNKDTGFDPKQIDLTDASKMEAISPNLFRVQKLASKDYWFRHHLETTIDTNDSRLKDITWKRIKSIQSLDKVVKVRINHIGQIVSVGEYD